MKNRPRPYIPITVRLKVAERQLIEDGYGWCIPTTESAKRRLGRMLYVLFGEGEAHLDHEPALRTRPYNPRIKDVAARYTPNANDPGALIYRDVHAHKVKTNVRGDHGQFPDRVLITRERRREKKARPKPKKAFRGAGRLGGGKAKILSRPFPPKGSRPFRR